VAGSAGTKRMGQNTIDTLGTTLRNQVARIQFAGAGTFQLSWRGALQTTAALTVNSTAASVRAALNSIAYGGGNPLNGNVTVQAIPGTPGSWWVTFTNGLAGTRINNTWLSANGGATVTTVWAGRSAAQGPGADANLLVGDFDNGLPANDALGLLFGINQTGVMPVNEVQTVSLRGAPTGGTFRLAFQQTATGNPQPAPLVTAPISWNATANDVRNALQALTDATGARPLNGNIQVTGGPGPGTPYTITFINGLAGADVNQLTVRNVALTGGSNPQVNVTTRTQGSGEVASAAGDSGGPVFIGNQIAGVIRGGIRHIPRPPFIGPDSSTFGEIEQWSRVSSYAAAGTFIPNTIAATASYGLVLDMQDQVLGEATDVAGNPLPQDPLTITASRGGPGNANLILTVTDANCPQLSGIYFSGLAANINTLTIRGNTGNDTFIIQGNLGIPNVTVVGRGGGNELEINDAADTANNVRYAVSSTDVRATGINGSGALTVNYMDIHAGLEVNGGSGFHQWTVWSTPACETTINSGTGTDDTQVLTTTGPLTINGQRGIDTVSVGNGRSLQEIEGNLDVTNTGGLTSLSLDDSADAIARNHVVLTAYSLSGLAPALISWTPGDINNLNISGGSGGNTFTVRTTPPGVAAAQATINTGTGNNLVNVQATQRRLNIIGQGGRDQVLIGNQGNAQGIQGQVWVSNNGNYTALTIDDSADNVPRTATLTASFLSGLTPADINWVERDLSLLTIKGGTGGNTFTVNTTPRNDFPVTTTLFTGAGNDTVNVKAANGPLTLNGQAGDDRIKFFNFKDSAIIDGGPGNDTIEVAQGTLATSQVPFTNVENVAITGGSTLNVNTDVSTGTILVQQGTLALQGGTPTVANNVQIQAQGILTGTGTINGNARNAGQVLPAGAGAVGRITVTNDYTQAAGGSLNLDLQGPEPGTQSDNLEVGHAVQLSGTLNLNALAGFNGNLFELVTNRGNDDVAGIFAGMAEGTAVTVGGRKFQISYQGGDGNDVVLHLVGQISTTTTVNSSVNPSTFGQMVLFTATVKAQGSGTPTGTVQFVIDGQSAGSPVTVSTNGGVTTATFSTSTLAVGTHTVMAMYSGDGSFLSSTGSLSGGQVVNKASTSTALTSSASSSGFNQLVTFTATITVNAPGNGTPSGAVQFQIDGSNVGQPVSVSTSGGVTTAAYSTNTLAVGTHTVTAVYSGDGSFLSSTGTLSSGQVIIPGPVTHFRVTAPSSATAGQPFTAIVTALDAFNNIATAYTGTVVFSSTDAQATLPSNYIFTPADNGVHSFTVTLRTAGVQMLTATDSMTASLTGNATIGVVAAAAAYLRMLPAQNTVYPGQPFAMTVTAYDAFGNIATGYRGTVHFTSSDPAAGLPADYQFTAADNGVHTFTGFELNTPGDQTITVTDTLDPALTITLLFRFQGS
jgi:hypothetical protein